MTGERPTGPRAENGAAPEDSQSRRGPRPPWLGYVIAVFICVLAYLDFSDDGKIDKLLIGAMVVLALAFAGYGGDRLIERISDRYGGSR